MKQGLEVLWWKHNMIPTKGSIQQTLLPPPPPPNIHLPQASHPLLTSTHSPISPSTLPYFFFITPIWWNLGGLQVTVDLLVRHRKQPQKCLQAAPPRPPTTSLRLLSQDWAKEKEILEDPWSPEERQSPAMHGEYPLLAHTFIQTRVGTPRGAPLSGASLFLKVPTGHPSVKPKAHLSLCSTFLIRLLLFSLK